MFSVLIFFPDENKISELFLFKLTLNPLYLSAIELFKVILLLSIFISISFLFIWELFDFIDLFSVSLATLLFKSSTYIIILLFRLLLSIKLLEFFVLFEYWLIISLFLFSILSFDIILFSE